MEPILEIAALKKYYGKEPNLTRALDGISFQVMPGEFLGIMGSSGSGKSTLLNCIATVIAPTGGAVALHDKCITTLHGKALADYRGKEIGYLFQNFELIDNLTGRENIFLNGAILGYPKDFLHDKAPEIIAYSELDRFIDRPLKTYSSGMLARLAFSIATVVQPDILIVDEILAVGDERFQRKSRARMLDLMSGGATVLFVSHNLSQIRELCDRVIWLEHGRIRAQGDAKSLCDAYEREAAP